MTPAQNMTPKQEMKTILDGAETVLKEMRKNITQEIKYEVLWKSLKETLKNSAGCYPEKNILRGVFETLLETMETNENKLDETEVAK